MINRNFRIGTGFLSTPFILQVLSDNGHTDLAYKMLLNPDRPGWLYEVLHGATTAWESWEGYTGVPGTGSYNHYSPGAVSEWLFATFAGIRVDGENHFHLQPVPDPTGSLTSVSASYKSIYGEVKSAWKCLGHSEYEFEFSIPANTTATVQLPDQTEKELESGKFTMKIKCAVNSAG